MKIKLTKNLMPLTVLVLVGGFLGCSSASTVHSVDNTIATDRPSSVIVQGSDLETVKLQILEVGGTVTHELGIIRAVGARLTTGQQEQLLEMDSALRIYADAAVQTSKRSNTDEGFENPSDWEWDIYPESLSTATTLMDAHLLHEEGIDGRGVSVAVLDTGLFDFMPVTYSSDFTPRILAQYDASRDREHATPDHNSDANGHGGHVTSIIANREVYSHTQASFGVAPGADLVVVKAFGRDGQGTYADVIRGIDWIVQNMDAYGVRVLNLSFGAPPQSYYWDDPLAQAVMAAWQAGIVVVASAGNLGPDPMTVGVPGNVPYVITVGAMSDNWTPEDDSDDVLTSFSSTGPTHEAFVKPEIVAPGGHLLGAMADTKRLAREHPEFHDGGTYFTMSGTSQAAAAVSGAVVLMLQADPSLTPDDVKCRPRPGGRDRRSARPRRDRDRCRAPDWRSHRRWSRRHRKR